MNELIHDLSIDLMAPLRQTVHVTQGDARTRVLRIKLYNNGEQYTPGSGALFFVGYRKSDGKTGRYDTVGDAPAVSISSNVLSARLADTVTERPGQTLLTVTAYTTGGEAICTFPVWLYVHPSGCTLQETPSESGRITTLDEMQEEIDALEDDVAALERSDVEQDQRIADLYTEGNVRYDTAQNLSNAQKTQARANIGAAGLPIVAPDVQYQSDAECYPEAPHDVDAALAGLEACAVQVDETVEALRTAVLVSALVRKSLRDQDIAHFEDGAGGLPLRALVVEIDAPGGASAVNVTRCGKNIFNPANYKYELLENGRAGWKKFGTTIADGVETSSAETSTANLTGVSGWWYWTKLPAGTYTVLRKTKYTSSVFRVACTADFPGATGVLTGFTARHDGQNTMSFTAPAGTQWIGIQVSVGASGKTSEQLASEIMLFIGTLDAPITSDSAAKAAFKVYYEVKKTVNFSTVSGGAVSSIVGGSVDLINGVLTDADTSPATTYSFDPMPINSLRGVNNVWADTGMVNEIEWYCDATLIYQELTA